MAQNNVWSDIDISTASTEIKERAHTPNSYRTVAFNTNNFLAAVNTAPSRMSDASTQRNSIIMDFPMPDGGFESFYLVDAELMHPDLAAKFPELKAYIGKGIDDPTADLRITYSPYHGFHGMIKSGEHSTCYIDPWTTDNENYIVYHRNELVRNESNWECLTPEPDAPATTIPSDGRLPLGDCNLRRYRIAVTCTGQYAQFHIGQAGGTTGNTAGDKAIVQSAMNVTMARVNGVYERDFGVTMQFVPNNDLVIYLNANTDPYGFEYNTSTAQTLDAEIGVNNYDIGHHFNNTNGGNAGCIDCVCLAVSQSGTHKGRGFSGQPSPVGDVFDIDYVSHEIGHQFGGFHTQSNSSCRSGSGATEVEPGSASTIMGYAGICPANVQNSSDDYFAYVNIRDIVTSVNTGNASTCPELITSGNAGPSADAGANYSIPISTPFKLEGIGSDPDDTGITFCWEQNDPESPFSNSAPSPTRTQGPMFRSLLPVSVPYRYMPNLDDLVNNINPTWEVLPSISRSMEFSFTVRDNNVNSGCTDSDLMSVNTVASAGPFVVTSPNTNGVVWGTNTTETITWNVAGTTVSPVSCANVDILMSTDGGFTYPIMLASSVPNDGSQDITVPFEVGTDVRVMVACSDNIFFDISNFDLEIEFSGPDFILEANPSSILACQPDNATYTVDVTAAGGFAGDVTLSALNLPAGANASFSTNPIAGGTGSSTLTVSSDGVTPGTYTITVQANGSVGTKTTTVDIEIVSTDAVTLVSPTDASLDVSLTPTLSWSADISAITYEVEVATDAVFSNIVFSETGLTTTSTTTSNLSSNTTHYWRVRSINDCGALAWSDIWIFRTSDICTPISISLSCSTPYNGDFNDSPVNNFTNYNGSNITYNGQDELFEYEHTGGEITVEVSGLTYDLTLLIMDDCDPSIATLLAEVSTGGSTRTYTNSSLVAGKYYIFLDAPRFRRRGTYTIEVTPCPVQLSPKVFLQGSFSGTSMNTDLDDLIPDVSPYADLKVLSSIMPADAVDWVYVEIRSDNTANPSEVYGQSGILLDDGTITDSDGVSPLSFPVEAGEDWYVVVRHRNHLGIMTQNPVTLN